MGDPDAKLRGQLRKLIDALREERTVFQERESAILAEIDKLLGGEPGIGAILKRVEAHWEELYRVRYGGPYVWTFVKDRPQLKRLIANLGVEELEGRMITFMQVKDDFFVRARHSFGSFVATVNQHASAVKQTSATCEHEPRCRDGWLHGQMLAAEANGDPALIERVRTWNGSPV